MGFIGILLYLAIIVVIIAGIWKTFEKAGQPGWAAIVPFYNIYILTVIAEKPAWWMILFFVPIANIVVAIMIYHAISLNFGKDVGFTLGLIFLGFIFFPILGFGDAVYKGKVNHISNDDLLDDNLLTD